MSNNNVFEKKFSDTMAQDKKAILEELNLPPALIDFIRKNSQVIKIVIAVFIIGVIGWEGYGKYIHSKQEKSSAMLYAAVNSLTSDEKLAQFKELSEKFSGSLGSGVWGSIELGHAAFEENQYQQASEYYNDALDRISKSNPLFPLVQFSLAQVYENMGESAKAKEAYGILVDLPGFAGEGYLGIARTAEKEGDAALAVSNYQEYLNLPGTLAGPTKDSVENKITMLKK